MIGGILRENAGGDASLSGSATDLLQIHYRQHAQETTHEERQCIIMIVQRLTRRVSDDESQAHTILVI